MVSNFNASSASGPIRIQAAGEQSVWFMALFQEPRIMPGMHTGLLEWRNDTELFFSYSSWDKGFFFVCLCVFWGGVGFWSRENGNNLERTRSSEEWRSIERESTLIAEGAQWPWGTRMSKGQRWKSKGSVRMPGGETEFGFFEDLKWGLLATLCLKGNCQEYRLKRSAGFKLPIKWWALSLAGT